MTAPFRRLAGEPAPDAGAMLAAIGNALRPFAGPLIGRGVAWVALQLSVRYGFLIDTAAQAAIVEQLLNVVFAFSTVAVVVQRGADKHLNPANTASAPMAKAGRVAADAAKAGGDPVEAGAAALEEAAPPDPLAPVLARLDALTAALERQAVAPVREASDGEMMRAWAAAEAPPAAPDDAALQAAGLRRTPTGLRDAQDRPAVMPQPSPEENVRNAFAALQARSAPATDPNAAATAHLAG